MSSRCSVLLSVCDVARELCEPPFIEPVAEVPLVLDVPSLVPWRITVVLPTSSFARSRVALSSVSKKNLFEKFDTIASAAR